MGNIVLTDANIEMLKYIASLKVMTEKQISALFYSKIDSLTFDTAKARCYVSNRLSQLAGAGFVSKVPIPSASRITRQGYVLGPKGALALKHHLEIENMHTANWLERKHTDVVVHYRHLIYANNFLINLILLSRMMPGFQLDEWIPDSDCIFYIKRGEKPQILDPDLYLATSNGNGSSCTSFVEIDCGTLTSRVLKRKVLRFFQYYESGKYRQDLASSLFPRVAVIVPDSNRVSSFSKAIRQVKENYAGKKSESLKKMPFCLTDFSSADINSIEEGRISRKPLEPIWVDENGRKRNSPLVK